MQVLVTGGAGYIGSHAVRVLLDAGHTVRVFDNLSTGHREAIDSRADFVFGDLLNHESIRAAVLGCDAVLHFAASSIVGVSCETPLDYWHNNVGGTNSLLRAMNSCGVDKFLFSSTAATYGIPSSSPITEETAQRPINPYGATKLAVEKMLLNYADSRPSFSHAILRYFNVGGSAWGLGEDHNPETHLLPIVLQCALGQRSQVAIFGTDYDTPDGTCVRDYVHVRDLVEAHVVVLEALTAGDRNVYNIGSGTGWSVRQVMDAAKDVTGINFSVIQGNRRAGDPASLVTDPRKIYDELGWRTQHSSLQTILQSHWAWTQAHPKGWSSAP